MQDYLKSILARKPDHDILHIYRNNTLSYETTEVDNNLL